MIKVRLCIPFYRDFEPAKTGLRQLKAIGNFIDRWTYEYDGIIFSIEPRRGTYPKGSTRDSLIEITHLANHRNGFISLSGDVEPFDVFLFIDSDIEWRLVDAVKLIKHDLDICGAAYTGHLKDDVFQAGTWGAIPGIIGERLPYGSNGLHKVDFIGAGMLSVKRDVFKRLPRPWFRHTIVNKTLETGEDYGFCLLCMGKYDIWCDCDIRPRHAEQPPIDWDF